MSTGRNTKLVGQTGEFLVCAELGRRGYVATPFAGNVPDFDLVALDENGRSVAIQVKTSNGSGSWQFSGRKLFKIRQDSRSGRQTVGGPLKVRDPKTICVLVWLGHRKMRPDRFFVLSRNQLLRLISDDYRGYLRRHSGVRPRNPNSTFIALRIAKLAKFEGQWSLIEKRLGRGLR